MSRRLSMLSAGTRNPAQCLASAFAVVACGDVAQGENADQTLVAIENRQAPDLNVRHIARDLFELLIVETIFDVLGHDIAHLGFRTFALSNPADGDVPIGHHAYQSVVLADGKHPRLQ